MGDIAREPGYRSVNYNPPSCWSDAHEPHYRRNLVQFVGEFVPNSSTEQEIAQFADAFLSSFPYRIWPGSIEWEWSNIEISDYVAPNLFRKWVMFFRAGNEEGMSLILKIESIIFDGPHFENDLKRKYYILLGTEDSLYDVDLKDFREVFEDAESDKQKRVLVRMYPNTYRKMQYEDKHRAFVQSLISEGYLSIEQVLEQVKVKEYWLNKWMEQGLVCSTHTNNLKFFSPEEVQKIVSLVGENEKKYKQK